MNLGFVLEHTLGHVTHAENLKRIVELDRSIHPRYVDLRYDTTPGWWASLPGVRSNWELRASLGAYLSLRKYSRELHGLLFHTQVTSLLSPGLMRRIPSVISLDATPAQFDAFGLHYGRSINSNPRVETLKRRLYKRAFGSASHLVAWSQWAKASLVEDYGIPAHKVAVIPPGIDTGRWNFNRRSGRPGYGLNILFVGGDFQRKGGDVLLKAFNMLPQRLSAHLHVVTKSQDIAGAGRNVTLYRDVRPNSPELLRLYAEADLFVFPTRADFLPLAVMEALAAGLPVITTRVAALPEAVAHGETGWIVAPEDVSAMLEAITHLAEDASMRARLGHNARAVALQRFDAGTNYRRLLDVVTLAAADRTSSAGT